MRNANEPANLTTAQSGNVAQNVTAIESECDARQYSADDCRELLHSLNSVLVSVLLSAQVLEWKLPSYSRLRRNLHEIERNAQRGGELVRRLQKSLDIDPSITQRHHTGLDRCGESE